MKRPALIGRSFLFYIFKPEKTIYNDKKSGFPGLF